eukprot:403335926
MIDERTEQYQSDNNLKSPTFNHQKSLLVTQSNYKEQEDGQGRRVRLSISNISQKNNQYLKSPPDKMITLKKHSDKSLQELMRKSLSEFDNRLNGSMHVDLQEINDNLEYINQLNESFSSQVKVHDRKIRKQAKAKTQAQTRNNSPSKTQFVKPERYAKFIEEKSNILQLPILVNKRGTEMSKTQKSSPRFQPDKTLLPHQDNKIKSLIQRTRDYLNLDENRNFLNSEKSLLNIKDAYLTDRYHFKLLNSSSLVNQNVKNLLKQQNASLQLLKKESKTRNQRQMSQSLNQNQIKQIFIEDVSQIQSNTFFKFKDELLLELINKRDNFNNRYSGNQDPKIQDQLQRLKKIQKNKQKHKLNKSQSKKSTNQQDNASNEQFYKLLEKSQTDLLNTNNSTDFQSNNKRSHKYLSKNSSNRKIESSNFHCFSAIII